MVPITLGPTPSLLGALPLAVLSMLLATTSPIRLIPRLSVPPSRVSVLVPPRVVIVIEFVTRFLGIETFLPVVRTCGVSSPLVVVLLW